jgi:hypothetical protein
MTGKEYRQAIAQLRMTQVGSARFFGVDASQARRWISGARSIPPAVEMLLLVMIRCGLSPHDVLDIANRDRVAS